MAPESSGAGPWLVAAWPGMGSVARIAADYLVEHLGAREVGRISAEDYFELEAVSVRRGLVQRAPLPQSRLFRWVHPSGGRDLVLFVGDRQPAQGGYRFCEDLLRLADEQGVERVVTFAALATPVHPMAKPRVLAVATDGALLEELLQEDVLVLADGQIGGLNGVLLAAAEDHGLGGTCLLGELPFFASSLPNPKASAAILRVFTRLARLELDLEPMAEHVEASERTMVQLLTQMQRAAGIEPTGETAVEESAVASEEPPAVPPEVEARIEELFGQTARDRSKALALKAELDRHGLFARYEDRFLDLFKDAE
jgi:uncharacterized protein